MVEIHFDGGDWEAEDRRVAALIAAITDLRPFWPKIVPLFVKWMGEQFESQGAWGGARWAPLSPAYEAWKQRHYPGRGILVIRGGRAPGLRYAAQTPARRATPQTLTLTIDKWLDSDGDILDPGWHQRGTEHMPARPIIPPIMPPSADDDVSRAAENYIEEWVTNLGLD